MKEHPKLSIKTMNSQQEWMETSRSSQMMDEKKSFNPQSIHQKVACSVENPKKKLIKWPIDYRLSPIKPQQRWSSH